MRVVARLLLWCFWGWQLVSAVVLLCLGLALAFEEWLGWVEAARPLAAIGIMSVLVIIPGWLPVTAILGGLLLLARLIVSRRERGRGGA